MTFYISSTPNAFVMKRNIVELDIYIFNILSSTKSQNWHHNVSQWDYFGTEMFTVSTPCQQLNFSVNAFISIISAGIQLIFDHVIELYSFIMHYQSISLVEILLKWNIYMTQLCWIKLKTHNRERYILSIHIAILKKVSIKFILMIQCDENFRIQYNIRCTYS